MVVLVTKRRRGNIQSAIIMDSCRKEASRPAHSSNQTLNVFKTDGVGTWPWKKGKKSKKKSSGQKWKRIKKKMKSTKTHLFPPIKTGGKKRKREKPRTL